MSEFNVLVGKRINGLFIGDDAWSLVFRDINGRHYCFRTEMIVATLYGSIM